MQTGGAGGSTADVLISRQPALPPKRSRPWWYFCVSLMLCVETPPDCIQKTLYLNQQRVNEQAVNVSVMWRWCTDWRWNCVFPDVSKKLGSQTDAPGQLFTKVRTTTTTAKTHQLLSLLSLELVLLSVHVCFLTLSRHTAQRLLVTEICETKCPSAVLITLLTRTNFI